MVGAARVDFFREAAGSQVADEVASLGERSCNTLVVCSVWEFGWLF